MSNMRPRRSSTRLRGDSSSMSLSQMPQMPSKEAQSDARGEGTVSEAVEGAERL